MVVRGIWFVYLSNHIIGLGSVFLIKLDFVVLFFLLIQLNSRYLGSF